MDEQVPYIGHGQFGHRSTQTVVTTTGTSHEFEDKIRLTIWRWNFLLNFSTPVFKM